jgi:preprotein translocase subunit SecB
MAEEKGMKVTGEEEGEGAKFNVEAQYLKDLSFENPMPLTFLGERSGESPKIEVGYDVDVHDRGGDRFEVLLRVRGVGKFGEDVGYVVEVVYGALVSLTNIPADHKPFLLFVEIPRLLFPYVRNVISDVSRDGGYQSLLLNGIDLVSLFKSKVDKVQGGGKVEEG